MVDFRAVIGFCGLGMEELVDFLGGEGPGISVFGVDSAADLAAADLGLSEQAGWSAAGWSADPLSAADGPSGDDEYVRRW